MRTNKILWFVGLLIFICSCSLTHTDNFEFLGSKKTGIEFNNQIPNYDYINILNHEYLYNGGGVAASDFNKDGLIDLVFSGNLVDNALYLNQGDFEFEDISEQSGISANGKWCTGVTIVDINDDGWSDIYFCTSSFNASTQSDNLLFVHQGLNDDGYPVFEEQASKYGLQSGKSSMHGHFFDYDRDGDLDLYLLNNVLDLVSPTDYRYKRINGEAPNTDQLFANDGNGNYHDVSKEAGVTIEGYGLGAAIADFNQDGWLDIYISNDYVTNDILYINQQDGTFQDEIAQRLDKQSKFCMGAIAADFNNDLSLDIVTLDMLAMDNSRLKQLYAASYYPNVFNNARYKYEEQNVRNMYHVNDGTGNFSEQGYMAGLIASDWSWSPLAADFDMDGDEDLYITNGFPKDITDLDFINYRKTRSMSLQRQELLDAIPEVKISNQLFINSGDSKFINDTQSQGLDKPTISHGSLAVDLDNDGDLDIVCHNLNDPASIIRNHTDSVGVMIEIDKSIPWSARVGTRIVVEQGDFSITKQWVPSHSYLSSIDAPIAIGGINISNPLQITTYWPDGTMQIMDLDYVKSRAVNIEKKDAQKVMRSDQAQVQVATTLLPKEVTIDRRSDFDYQKTIPIGYHDYECPMVISSDKIVVAHPRDKKIYKLNNQGEIIQIVSSALFITQLVDEDINNDGSSEIFYSAIDEYGETSIGYYSQDDLSKPNQIDQSLPMSYRFEVGDIDADGRSDMIYATYPYKGSYPEGSHILIVEDIMGKAEVKDTLSVDGVIRDIILNDIDDDGDKDLIVVGHWMAPGIWVNKNGNFELEEFNLDSYSGLWNSIDYLYTDDRGIHFGLGNIGLNTALTGVSSNIKMVANDIDNNGTVDPIVGFSYDDEENFIPYDLRDDLVLQLPSIKKIYANYHDYSNVQFEDLLTDLNIEPTHEVEFVSSAILTIGHNRKADIQELSKEAQIAPIYSMEYIDKTTELLLVGNTTQNREFWGSYTSSDGIIFNLSDGIWQYDNDKSVAFRAEGEGRILKEWNDTVIIAYRDGRVEQLTLSTDNVQ